MACGLYNERERRKNGKRIKMGREKWEEEESLAWEWNGMLTFIDCKKKMVKSGLAFGFRVR